MGVRVMGKRKCDHEDRRPKIVNGKVYTYCRVCATAYERRRVGAVVAGICPRCGRREVTMRATGWCRECSKVPR